MAAPPRGAPGGAGAGTLRHFYCRVVTAEAKLVRADTARSASEPEIARPRSHARSPARRRRPQNTLLALIGALRAATAPLAVVVVCR